RREKGFGQRIDIAGDELTGDATANVLAKASNQDIKYEGFDPEYMRKDNADFATMFEWFDKVGYSVDINKLKQDYPEVQWQSLQAWAQEQDWSVLK
ncbi:MAG: NmrA/HSCARG family protein, partial [Nanoarchaeota archaeon]|nr:NmrA/HSCARG family protein [Nanoarchaeota archaeon]